MAAAARLTDPIGHSPTMSWLLKGLLMGAAIAVVGVAIIGTGGLAAVAIVGGAAAMGAGLGEAMSSMSWAPKEVVGAITAAGASRVFVNSMAAVRAHLDFATCSKHPTPATIATGSGTVYINGAPAARVNDKTICSATITKGSANVFIGGPTVQTDEIQPENLVPGWVHAALFVVGVGSALVLAAPAIVVGGLILGTLGGAGGHWAGGKIFGEGSDGQKWMGIGGAFIGGLLGAKGASAAMRARVAEPPVVNDLPAPPAIGVPASRSSNSLSAVLERDALGNEIMYRTMSEQQYQQFLRTGTMPHTTETSISPSLAYSSKYDGVTVKITVAPGTSARLQQIGIAANKPASEQFPGMSTQTGKWMQSHVRFKVEGGQMTTQLGKGKGIDIFNENIVDFEMVPK